MCLITKQKRVKIAKQDIVCYKTFDRIEGKLTSVYFPYFTWERNKLYKTDIVFSDDVCFADNEVHQKYSPKSVEDRLKKEFDGGQDWINFMRNNFTIIGPGFHFAFAKQRLIAHGWIHYECIIPKGSRYYTDATGLGVTNQIIVK